MRELGSGQRTVLDLVSRNLVIRLCDVVTLTDLSRERVRQICSSLEHLGLIEAHRESDGVLLAVTMSGMKRGALDVPAVGRCHTLHP